MMLFYKNATNNGRTGTNLTSLALNGGPVRTIYNVTKGIKKITPGIAKIGKGAQGTVYLGHKDPEAKIPITIKTFRTAQIAISEFEIGKALYKVSPRHIPRYESFLDEKTIMTEYFHGGDLREWLKKVKPRLTFELLVDIIRQVLSTLVAIRQAYPKFRHNDLHTGNIFVDDTGARPRIAIGDFGMSVLTPTIGSQEVFNGYFKQNGVSVYTPEQYDALIFLIDMRNYVRNYPILLDLIHSILPPPENLSKDGRLIMPYNGPSTKKILAMIMNASTMAVAALKNVPGVKVTAANYLKMSPASKAAYKAAQQVKPSGPMKFTKAPGNITGKKPTNVLAFAKLTKPSPKKFTNVYSLNKLFKTPAGPTKAGKLPLQLKKSPGGRVRMGKKLLLSFKRDELVRLARKYGVAHQGKVKQEIVDGLWKAKNS